MKLPQRCLFLNTCDTISVNINQYLLCIPYLHAKKVKKGPRLPTQQAKQRQSITIDMFRLNIMIDIFNLTTNLEEI